MNLPPTSSTAQTASELRRAFLDYFQERGHTAVPSAPLVPNDPTLLFTTAGMVQFKAYYTAADVPYTRAVSIQKCLRLTDLENVGTTPRHDTFFEMLGNFSFGPRERGAYFKEESIAFGWEFTTRTLGLPRERLYVSVFNGEGGLPRDDEAASLWRKLGVADDHIVALGRADNFWGPAGGQGACGPCSEMYFDLGEKRPDYLPPGAFWGESPGDAGDRYMEFWNHVFPQFNAQPDGTLIPLARPGIDTGMGIERLALIVQGKSTIFDTDAFAPLVDHVLSLSSARAGDATAKRDARIIADHARALTFAIAEGAMPGNEGAGYVLRRLLRRAVTRGRSRQGLAIGDRALLADLSRLICERYGESYPELPARRDTIMQVLESEEASFAKTYEAGLQRLERIVAEHPASISGNAAFELHDTYGFPVELTEEMARERGVAVDREGFERAMEEQRTRARESSRFTKGEERGRAPWTIVSEGQDSEFVGYDHLEMDGLQLRRWRPHGEREIEVVLDRTPFYAESGGQVSDRGRLTTGSDVAAMTHVHKEDDAIVHRVDVGGNGEKFVKQAVSGIAGRVDAETRYPTMRHHTATHLLHAALRQELGTHVRQAGSLVAPDRLRFDYNHFEAPSRVQLEHIERTVAEWVLRNRPVTWKVMPIAEAKGLGAMALFGEKYGERVRVVTVEGVEEASIPKSLELCGGTHVTRTGDIGAFIVTGDSSIASGVRRIEALCGHEALQFLKAQGETLHRVATALQSSPATVLEQVEKLRGENERLRKATAQASRGGLEAEMARLATAAVSAPQGRWIVAEIESADTNAVRDAADRLRGELQRGAAVIAVRGEGKLAFLAAVTDDLVSEKRLRADELVRAVAKITGGSGGGKPHLALAGGKDASKLAEALAEARRLLEQALSG